jgi:hypothetical protein
MKEKTRRRWTMMAEREAGQTCKRREEEAQE